MNSKYQEISTDIKEASVENNFNLTLTIQRYIELLNEVSKLKFEKNKAISKERYELAADIKMLEKEKIYRLNNLNRTLHQFYNKMEFNDVDSNLEMDFFEILLTPDISKLQNTLKSEIYGVTEENLFLRLDLHHKKDEAIQINLTGWKIWIKFLEIRKRRIEEVHGSRKEVRLINKLLGSSSFNKMIFYESDI